MRYANEKEFTRSIRLGKQTLSKFVNAITISKDGTRWIGSRFKGMLAYTSQLDLKWHTMENCTLMQRLNSKERIGALRRFVRTSLGQHRRPHRLLQHPPSDDPRHTCFRNAFGQPLLRGRPARRMGGDDFGAPV